jgi:hypothetical protein
LRAKFKSASKSSSASWLSTELVMLLCWRYGFYVYSLVAIRLTPKIDRVPDTRVLGSPPRQRTSRLVAHRQHLSRLCKPFRTCRCAQQVDSTEGQCFQGSHVSPRNPCTYSQLAVSSNLPLLKCEKKVCPFGFLLSVRTRTDRAKRVV